MREEREREGEQDEGRGERGGKKRKNHRVMVIYIYDWLHPPLYLFGALALASPQLPSLAGQDQHVVTRICASALSRPPKSGHFDLAEIYSQLVI